MLTKLQMYGFNKTWLSLGFFNGCSLFWTKCFQEFGALRKLSDRHLEMPLTEPFSPLHYKSNQSLNSSLIYMYTIRGVNCSLSSRAGRKEWHHSFVAVLVWEFLQLVLDTHSGQTIFCVFCGVNKLLCDWTSQELCPWGLVR